MRFAAKAHDLGDYIDLRFSSEELELLDKASALPPEYPGWMLEFTGGDRKA